MVASIGDHIRARRLDLGLLQKDVAEHIGVDKNALTRWELNQAEPQIRYLPKIITFLGYVPFARGESFPEKLKAYRMRKGLTQRELARELGVDPTTVRKWEAEMSKPMRRLRDRVLGIIDGS